MRYPLAQYSEEPVIDYPLTKDELRALALFWSDKYLETSVFCCHSGQVGSTDLRMWDYANDRLTRIAAILGEDEVKKVDAEVVEIMRDRMGEELWTAFQEGRSVEWVPVDKEEEIRRAERKERIERAEHGHRSKAP